MREIIPILLCVYTNRPLMVLSALKALQLCCLAVEVMLLPGSERADTTTISGSSSPLVHTELFYISQCKAELVSPNIQPRAWNNACESRRVPCQRHFPLQCDYVWRFFSAPNFKQRLYFSIYTVVPNFQSPAVVQLFALGFLAKPSDRYLTIPAHEDVECQL